MFLRKLRAHKDGKEHAYWSLVETVRTADGPRQRTLCYLGELESSSHARWQKSVELFNEHGKNTQLKLFLRGAEAPDDPNVAPVLVMKARVERTRHFSDNPVSTSEPPNTPTDTLNVWRWAEACGYDYG